ncbi:hypothetical protein D3C87_1413990 [compost metagenome]
MIILKKDVQFGLREHPRNRVTDVGSSQGDCVCPCVVVITCHVNFHTRTHLVTLRHRLIRRRRQHRTGSAHLPGIHLEFMGFLELNNRQQNRRVNRGGHLVSSLSQCASMPVIALGICRVVGHRWLVFTPCFSVCLLSELIGYCTLSGCYCFYGTLVSLH